MDIQDLIKRNKEVWKYYVESDKQRLGHEWPRGEYTRALAADIGALIKLTMAKDGLRDVDDSDQKLMHEMGDCLSALFIVAEKYGIDIEQAFLHTMDELETRGKNMDLARSHSL